MNLVTMGWAGLIFMTVFGGTLIVMAHREEGFWKLLAIVGVGVGIGLYYVFKAIGSTFF